MQSLTYRFTGPAHRSPISSTEGDPVICQLLPDEIDASANGSVFILGTITSRSHSGMTWTYVVEIEDAELAPGIAVSGKFNGVLSALSPAIKYLRATAQAIRLNHEVFTQTEALTDATRWVSNPDASGTIIGVRVSVFSIGDGTLQLTLNGDSILPEPVTLNALTQFITLSIPIVAGDRLNAVTTGAEEGAARGLQISLRIQP